MVARVPENGLRKARPAQAGIDVSRAGVLVTAFGENPDGPGILLRLWEHEGRGGRCTVRLPAAGVFNRAQPVDLRGTPCGPAIEFDGRALPVSFRPFAPTSFILTRATNP